MGKDIGTYHVRVTLADGRGWIETFHTGARYFGGTSTVAPLDARRLEPSFDSEADVIRSAVYNFINGNGSCDCNKLLSLARAYQQPEPKSPPCGEMIVVQRLDLIRPDGTELEIYRA